MQFIKNKTTHTAKYLLTSSVLILNGNNLCTGKIPLKSNQPSLQPTTPYSPMGHKPKTREDFIQKVQQLKAASLAVSHDCDQLIKDYNQTLDSLDNDATSPMPSMDDKATDSGYESEDSYDTIPYSSFNIANKAAQPIYDEVPNEEEEKEKEEPIYEEIKESHQGIDPDHAKQTNSNHRSTATYYKNGIPCTDL